MNSILCEKCKYVEDDCYCSPNDTCTKYQHKEEKKEEKQMSNIQHPTRKEIVLFAEHERLWEIVKDFYEYYQGDTEILREIMFQMLATIELTENLLKRFNKGGKNE